MVLVDSSQLLIARKRISVFPFFTRLLEEHSTLIAIELSLVGKRRHKFYPCKLRAINNQIVFQSNKQVFDL